MDNKTYKKNENEAFKKETIHDFVDNIPPGKDSPDEGNLKESGEQLVGTGGSSHLPPPSPHSEEQLVQAPPTDPTGEYDYMREFGDEQFQTSPSQFDMDYLERVSSNTNPTAMSSLARDSLFVKFDPLVGGKTPGNVYRQPHPSHNIPSGDYLLMLDTPRQNLQQPPDEPTKDDSVKVFKYTEEDMEEIKQQYEVMLVKARQEHAVESAKQQKKMDRLVRELQNLRAHNTIVLTDKTLVEESNQDLEKLCTQYQQTETEILNAYEKLKEDVKVVEQERNQAFKDFASLEKSFTEFHQRYTKSKKLVTELQETVSALQEYTEELEAQLNRTKQINTELQSEVNLKLQEANETYDKIKKEHASEAAVFKASLRKMTLEADGLKKQLDQKEHENVELNILFNDLMKELGNKK